MPASNVTRVRRLGRWNSRAIVRPRSGRPACRRVVAVLGFERRGRVEETQDFSDGQVGDAQEVPALERNRVRDRAHRITLAGRAAAAWTFGRPRHDARRGRDATNGHRPGAVGPGCSGQDRPTVSRRTYSWLLPFPFPTETAPEPTRTTPLLVALPARPRIPDLDRTMQRLSAEHATAHRRPGLPLSGLLHAGASVRPLTVDVRDRKPSGAVRVNRRGSAALSCRRTAMRRSWRVVRKAPPSTERAHSTS